MDPIKKFVMYFTYQTISFNCRDRRVLSQQQALRQSRYFSVHAVWRKGVELGQIQTSDNCAVETGF